MAIRTKLYAAILVTVLGLTVAAGVGIWGMSRVGDRFDAVQHAAAASSLALQLKFDVTDFNGWQTAYGYDNGRSRPSSCARSPGFRTDLAHARASLSSPGERRLLRPDRVRVRRLHAARRGGVRRRSERADGGGEATPARARDRELSPCGGGLRQSLASLESSKASRDENASFRDTRRDALRLLLIATLVTGLFVVILLVTANDLARTAEGRIEDARAGDSRDSARVRPGPHAHRLAHPGVWPLRAAARPTSSACPRS